MTRIGSFRHTSPTNLLIAGGLMLAIQLTMAPPPPAAASPYDNRPKILLHLQPIATKLPVCGQSPISQCEQGVTRGGLLANYGSYYAYLLVATGPHSGSEYGGDDLGIAGLQLSIDYDPVVGSGVDVFGWVDCANAHFDYAGPHGEWPAALSNNLLTWNPGGNCQRRPVALAGYFYLAAYTPGTLRVIPRRVDGIAAVADCNAAMTELAAKDLGWLNFTQSADVDGCNPCTSDCRTLGGSAGPGVPVEPTTWSRIKGTYP